MTKSLFLILTASALILAGWALLRTNDAAASARAESARLQLSVALLGDSLSALNRAVDSLKDLAPGLGEFMTGIQLHAAKLWYAGHAANWDLAAFEVNELREAMEGAEALHAVRNRVNTAAVISAVRETQVRDLGRAVGEKKGGLFDRAYGNLIAACNDCHRTSGYPFLRIIPPSGPPVTNQEWRPVR